MIIHCEERLCEAQGDAAQLGDKSLQECFERLESREQDGHTMHRTRISHPIFYFRLKTWDGRLGMNGGLLHHGTPDRSYAVTCAPKNFWQIHT